MAHSCIPKQPRLAGREAVAVSSWCRDSTSGRWEATYNTKAALFAQAIAEVVTLVRRVRGDVATATGLGAVGDLFVTGVAGRNRTFGELRGSGLATDRVVADLQVRDELTEGYAAIRMGHAFTRQRRIRGVPLLEALYAIVYRDADVERELLRAVLGQGRSPQRSPRSPRSRG